MTPRGIRNNNPGNIRISAVKYQGEIQPSQDKAFKQFESMPYGYRAMFVLLKTYYTKHGLKTIRAWINRYAPPVENHTGRYIDYVAGYAGISPDEEIDLGNRDVFIKIVAGMSKIENGIEPDLTEIKIGYKLI